MAIENPSTAGLPATFNQAVEALRAVFHGQLVLPGDPDYDAARGVLNASIDRHPALVARCEDLSDVVNAVTFARDLDLPLAVRSGGHSISGYGTVDAGVVADLSPMHAIHVNPANRTARIEPGAVWKDVAETLLGYGMALSSGDTGSVGVGGLTTGGGMGWMVRSQGLTIDNLRSAEVVLAGGRVVTASATENADLFWGIRGGGGNFGVVTSFEFDVYPLGLIVGGAVFYPIDEAKHVLLELGRIGHEAPDELTVMGILMSAPPAPFIPPEHHFKPVVAVAACYCGDQEEGMRVVQPLRSLGTPIADILGPMPYPGMFKLTEEASRPGLRHDVRSILSVDLGDELLESLIAGMRTSPSPLTLAQVRALGGAMSRVPNDATAFCHRDVPYVVTIIGVSTSAEQEETVVSWMDALWPKVRPHADGVYVNFMYPKEDVRDAYTAEAYARLAALKAKYDPNNLFRLNVNIPPSE